MVAPREKDNNSDELKLDKLVEIPKWKIKLHLLFCPVSHIFRCPVSHDIDSQSKPSRSIHRCYIFFTT